MISIRCHRAYSLKECRCKEEKNKIFIRNVENKIVIVNIPSLLMD